MFIPSPAGAHRRFAVGGWRNVFWQRFCDGILVLEDAGNPGSGRRDPNPTGLRVGLSWDRINRGDAVYGPARQSLFVQNGQQGGHEYLPERMGNTPDGRFRPDARSDVADRRAGNRHRRCRDERAPASLRLTSASFQPGKPDICVASGAHGQSLASFRNTAAGFFPYGNSWLMRPEAQSWSCSRWNGTCGRHGFSSQAMRP